MRHRANRFVRLAILVTLFPLLTMGSGSALSAEDADVTELRRRAESSDDLAWLTTSTGAHPWITAGETRTQLVQAKHQALEGGDASSSARASAVLSAEAQTRAARVLDRWLSSVDQETGLIPKGRSAKDQVWDYADAGADLFPHLVIAAKFLRPGELPRLTQVLTSERSQVSSDGLRESTNLTTNLLVSEDLEDRMYGAVEYAKDGMLPLVERLGDGPWEDRLQELSRSVEKAGRTETRFGLIASDSSEVNGQAMQVLSRLYWMTRDDAYFTSGSRLTKAYLDLALPSTGWIPGRSWDFRRERSNTHYAQLRDHGNEIVAGLVEFHLIETALGLPIARDHRSDIHAMLDQLLDRGRTSTGLWKSAFDFNTGESLKDTISDNWGYVFSAYLTQAMIEERWPDGDAERALRYREAAARGLNAAAAMDLYPWQGREQDGYADTIESALYLLKTVPSLTAARWVDRQAGTLFGVQGPDGLVEDRYLDGNFIRTALLYSAWQAQGVRLDPWEPGAMVGAAMQGSCAVVALASAQDWSGRVHFDAPRHNTNLGLPMDYPRLNAWPEWFTAEANERYDLSESGAISNTDGATLTNGLPIYLQGGIAREITVCPASA